MTPSQIIVLATPVFIVLIALEVAWSWRAGRLTGPGGSHKLNDAIGSLSLGVISQLSGVFLKLLQVGVYAAVYQSVSLLSPETAEAFWMSWGGWLLALLFYDFCYYWLHRAGHEVAIFWAAHVVHHQSQQYNLTTALRQTSTGSLLGWVFYLPMALAGVPPMVFVVVGLIDLLYQFWVHTEQIRSLGWFDRWFCSPSNHRVHHAVNDDYLDRNYGGVLIIWDRLFGTFEPENPKQPCVYGTRKPLNSWDPVWANAEVYWQLFRDAWRTRRWRDKGRVFLAPPGWQPQDLAASEPQQRFDIINLKPYDPQSSSVAARLGVVGFCLLLAAAGGFLWNAHALTGAQSFAVFAGLLAGYWALCAMVQGRLSVTTGAGLQILGLAVTVWVLGNG